MYMDNNKFNKFKFLEYSNEKIKISKILNFLKKLKQNLIFSNYK